MIKGVLFDKDGTLFDYNATWGAWTLGMLEKEAKGDPQILTQLADVLGYDVDNQVFFPDSLVIASTAGELADAILTVVSDDRDTLLDRMNREASIAPQLEAAPLVSLFKSMKEAGLKLGIATNDSEAPARVHLQKAGVEGLFDFIAGYDSGFGGKPEPGMQKAFCETTGLAPHEVAMVGDSTHDLFAGKAAGMLRVAVLTGVATREELAPHADHVLNDIGELPALLGIS